MLSEPGKYSFLLVQNQNGKRYQSPKKLGVSFPGNDIRYDASAARITLIR